MYGSDKTSKTKAFSCLSFGYLSLKLAAFVPISDQLAAKQNVVFARVGYRERANNKRILRHRADFDMK